MIFFNLKSLLFSWTSLASSISLLKFYKRYSNSLSYSYLISYAVVEHRHKLFKAKVFVILFSISPLVIKSNCVIYLVFYNYFFTIYKLFYFTKENTAINWTTYQITIIRWNFYCSNSQLMNWNFDWLHHFWIKMIKGIRINTYWTLCCTKKNCIISMTYTNCTKLSWWCIYFQNKILSFFMINF